MNTPPLFIQFFSSKNLTLKGKLKQLSRYRSVLTILISLIALVGCSNSPKSTQTPVPVDNATPTLEGFTQADKAIFGSAFIYSVSSNNIVDAERLLSVGAKVNAPNPVNETPLEIAINNNSVEMVRFLLENGASPNYFKEPVSCNAILATASGGDTRFYVMPLEKAQQKGHQQIISLLKQAGAKSAAECFEADNAERKLLESLSPSY